MGVWEATPGLVRQFSNAVNVCSQYMTPICFFFKFPDLCLTKCIAETQLDGEGEQQPGCTKGPAALGATCGTPPGKAFEASNEVANFLSC